MQDRMLDGQVALVTGSSAGLGRRFALTLADAGAQVAVAARRVDRLEDLAKEIRDAGGSALPVRLDVTDAHSIVDAVDAAQRELGLVTILVNNAGIPDAQYATRMPLELVDRVLATNLRGPWLLACEVARRLIESSSPGKVVNISSIGAFNYSGGAAALYSVTKAAINRMTEVLAVEWARFRINVNAIAPGAFASEMMDGMIARLGDQRLAERLADPSELDSTLLYLVSPESQAVTGTIVKVDKGLGPR
jgi:NAD(P)-dependent dehydrogenase (short-subunit alcohol dehydrogenase family)